MRGGPRRTEEWEPVLKDIIVLGVGLPLRLRSAENRCGQQARMEEKRCTQAERGGFIDYNQAGNAS